MTPAVNHETAIDQLKSFPLAYKQHHLHHQDTADLLMQVKDAQDFKTLDARQHLLKTKSHENDASSVTTAVDSPDNISEDFHDACGPFEGPEKLLELWFAEEATDVDSCLWDEADARPNHFGLRSVPKAVWESMLDIVKCKVLSVVQGAQVDAYLLSESSMFVFPHKLILKTCGTTTLLLGLEKLLIIANKALANLPRGAKILDASLDDGDCSRSDSSHEQERLLGTLVKHAFYSRKSFMFPERQKGPHRDWMLEVAVLDRFFDCGSAYTVGKMNGDHWLLWMGCEGAREPEPSQSSLEAVAILDVERPLPLPSPCVEDQTLEILMTHLSSASCARFVFDEQLPHPTVGECFPHKVDGPGAQASVPLDKGHALGLALSNRLGLTDLFPNTDIDAFAFEPCGYSANAVMPRGGTRDNAGYWTIHVTPEEGSSYASFETNVALCSNADSSRTDTLSTPTNLPGLVRRVVNTFEPGKLSVTLFVSTYEEQTHAQEHIVPATAKVPLITNEDILHALTLNGYKRTDRIAYEFERYNLVFVSFEKRPSC